MKDCPFEGQNYLLHIPAAFIDKMPDTKYPYAVLKCKWSNDYATHFILNWKYINDDEE
jgi:hypothetical protein